MKTLTRFRDAKPEVVTQCSHCEKSIEHTSCINCQSAIGKEFKCSGYGDESWHECNECYEFLKNLACPNCNAGPDGRLDRYGIDTSQGKKIINECRNCKHKFETDR